MNYNDFGLRIEYVEYTVKKGDSLYEIAKKYNTTVNTLTDINMLTTNTIFPGQVLLIPSTDSADKDYYFESYTVQPGDNLELIANKHGVDPVLLGLYNDFSSYQLVEGQTIKIPRNNTYVVRNTDTVDTILNMTNTTAEQILRANAKNWLKAGSKINL